jgi:hypothetical protein
MKQTKTLTIGDDKRTITVSELTVKDIKALWSKIEELSTMQPKAGVPLTGLPAELRPFWEKCVVGLSFEDLDDYAPSELRMAYDAFVEVNAGFFELASRVEGGSPFAMYLRTIVVSNLLSRFAGLSNMATPGFGTTATPSS